MEDLPRNVLLDLWKDKSNAMNQAYQRFQADLKSVVKELLQCEAGMQQKSTFSDRIQRLLSDFSFEMNQIQTSYLERSKYSHRSTHHLVNKPEPITFSSDNVPIAIQPSNIMNESTLTESIVDCSSVQNESVDHNFASISTNVESRHRCHECSKSFRRASGLKEHRIQIHTVETPFHCDHIGCDKAFKLERYLRHHVRTDHDGYPYPCPEQNCQEAFKYKQELDVHQKSKHIASNDINLRPSKRRKIDTDLNTHSASRQSYQCDICFATFSSGAALGGHKSRAHRNRSYQTSSDSALQGKARVNSEFLERKWPCGVCGKRFRDRSYLRKHELLHKAERPFECSLCDKAYVDKNRLDTHLYLVHGVKPFQCGQCDKAFAKKKDLTTHYATCRGTNLASKRDEEKANEKSHKAWNSCATEHQSFSFFGTMATSVEMALLDLLKEKSNVMNQAYQQFQKKLKSTLEELLSHQTIINQKSLYNDRIQHLLSDFSFEMNQIETSYYERCEASLQRHAIPTNLVPNNVTSNHNHSSDNNIGFTNPQNARFNRQFKKQKKSIHSDHQSISNDEKINVQTEAEGDQTIWKCIECDIEYLHLSSLRRHNREKHSNSVNREITSNSNSRPTKRRRIQMDANTVNTPSTIHRQRENTMDSDSAELKWKCGFCGARFKKKTYLRNHELIHNKERPFKCTLCDSAFVLESRLRTHLLGVHGVKSFRCERCHKAFAKKKDLTAHYAECRGVNIAENDENEEVEKRLSEIIDIVHTENGVNHKKVFNERL